MAGDNGPGHLLLTADVGAIRSRVRMHAFSKQIADRAAVTVRIASAHEHTIAIWMSKT